MLRVEEIIRSMGEISFWEKGFNTALAECTPYCSGLNSRDIKHIYISGCGTSCYAAYYGKALIEKYSGIPCGVMEGNLGESFSWELADKNTLFIGISNTGGSETVCRTMERAAASGAGTLALTGVRDSRLAGTCGALLYFSGTEDDVPTKTRSYIETLMMLLAFALCLGNRDETIKNSFRAKIAEAGKAAANIIAAGQKDMPALADELQDCFSFTVVGTGLHLANVYEGALKVSELGWMNTGAFEIENYMHGRFRGSNAACPYLIFAPEGPGYEKALDFLAVAHKKGTKAIVVTDKITPPVRDLAHRGSGIPPGLDREILPMVDIIPLYQLGLCLGIRHGWADPAPRNDGLIAQSARLADLYPQYA
jgi:glucosamine--fructose-6-phosphate aminotransferase (isomerizing)